MLAAVTEMLIGGTGLIGYLMRFIRPISIAVTITLLGLTLAPIPLLYCKVYWPAAIVYVEGMCFYSVLVSFMFYND